MNPEQPLYRAVQKMAGSSKEPVLYKTDSGEEPLRSQVNRFIDTFFPVTKD